MDSKLHNEIFSLLTRICDQYEGVTFTNFDDFGNCIRASSKEFSVQNDECSFSFHFDIAVHPGHDNFSENYFSVYRTTYVNEHLVKYMEDCIVIPCTYIDNNYYDKRKTRAPILIPKDVFYGISEVLKEYQKIQNHINIITIHYYLKLRVNL